MGIAGQMTPPPLNGVFCPPENSNRLPPIFIKLKPYYVLASKYCRFPEFEILSIIVSPLTGGFGPPEKSNTSDINEIKTICFSHQIRQIPRFPDTFDYCRPPSRRIKTERLYLFLFYFFFYYHFKYFIGLFYPFHCLSFPFLEGYRLKKGHIVPVLCSHS